MNNLEKTIKILKKGGIVIFPTDTAFGIGCRIDDKKAVERLFKLRKRADNKPVPVLVDSVEMAKSFLKKIPENVLEKLIKPFWPGALTIILKCEKTKIPSLVRGGGDTLGVRMPDKKQTLALIKGVGVPILGPSANFSNGKTPFKIEEIDKKLISLVDYVLSGDTKRVKTSTVIDCSKNSWEVLRKGEIEIKKNIQKNIVLDIDTATMDIKASLIVNGKSYS